MVLIISASTPDRIYGIPMIVRTAISDAGVSAALLGAALRGAALNIFINTKSMADAKYAAKLNERAEALTEEYGLKADRIYQTVCEGLKGGI